MLRLYRKTSGFLGPLLLAAMVMYFAGVIAADLATRDRPATIIVNSAKPAPAEKPAVVDHKARGDM